MTGGALNAGGDDLATDGEDRRRVTGGARLASGPARTGLREDAGPWTLAPRRRMLPTTPGEGAHDMRIEPEIDGVSIVLLGDFNPAIFAPAWFALHGLLPRGATDGANVQIVCPQVTAFTFDWLRLEVVNNRFNVETLQAPHIHLRDLVLRTFKERVPHAPHGSTGASVRPMRSLSAGFRTRK